jgi:glutamine synthetase
MSKNPTKPAAPVRPDLSAFRDVECVFPDVGGFPRGKIQRAADSAAGKELRIAQAIILQTVTGEYADDAIIGAIDEDTRLHPDWRTLRALPWAPGRAWLVHDCVGFDGRLVPFAARSVLLRVLASYAERGLTPVVAPELEFYLFQRDGREEEGFNLPATRGGTREVRASAYSVSAANELNAFWDELYASFEKLHIATDTWLHEMGPSQFEINLLHGDALALADQVMLFKYALREVAARHGLYAVFMAKPLAGQSGSSMHIHQSVVDAAGRNIFSNADGTATPAFLAYIGGLQHHLADLMPIFAPYINSWRRYVNHSGAPVSLDWGLDNRTVALRVPRSAPEARRVENRLAGSDANPHLAIAASLACGLRGMEEERVLRPAVDDRSGYAGEREIPRSIEGAVERLYASTTAREMLGDVFIEGFCSVKEVELDHYMNEVSAWDRRFLTSQA